MFTNIYRDTALFDLGVIGIHLVNSGPDMLLILLKTPTNNSAPSSPTKTYQLSIEFFNGLLFDYFMSINWSEACFI